MHQAAYFSTSLWSLCRIEPSVCDSNSKKMPWSQDELSIESIFRWRDWRTYLQKHLGLKLAAVPKAVSIEGWFSCSQAGITRSSWILEVASVTLVARGHCTWHLTTAAGLQSGTCQAIINPQRLSNWSLVHRIVTKASLETYIRQAWGPSSKSKLTFRTLFPVDVLDIPRPSLYQRHFCEPQVLKQSALQSPVSKSQYLHSILHCIWISGM